MQNRSFKQCYDNMSRLLIPRIINVSNDRGYVRIFRGRQRSLPFTRWISVLGSKSGENVVGQQRSTKPASTTNHNEKYDYNNTEQKKPVIRSIVDEISKMQRRPPILTANPSSTIKHAASSTNHNGNHKKNEPLSFFQSSNKAQSQQQQQQQQQQQRYRGDQIERQSNSSLIGESSRGNEAKTWPTLTLRGPSNIPLRTETSMFDVFQVPEPAQIKIPNIVKRSPNAFPLEAVKHYYEILEPVLESGRFFKRHTNTPISEDQAKPILEWLKSDEPTLLYDLPTFQAAIKGELNGSTAEQKQTARLNLRAELCDQSARFVTYLDLPFDRITQLAFSGLFVCTSMCARHGKGGPVEVIWEKMKESGIYNRELLQNLLYVSATFTTGCARSRRKRRSKYGHLAGIASILDVLDVHDSTASTDNQETDLFENEADLVDITDEIAIFHDLLFEPSEQSINIRVKLLVAQGKAKEAERLLDEISSGEAELRLRAYTPVLRLFIELNDVSSALQLFRKMKNIPTVHLDGDAFMHLIAGIAEKGRFCVGAEPIESAAKLEYKNMSGPGLFDEVITEMAQAVFEIPEASAKRLYNAMAIGFPDCGLNEMAVHSLKFSKTRARDHELFASRVRIQLSDGQCRRSGVKLRLIHLTDEDKQTMVNKVLLKAKTENVRFNESYKNRIWRGASSGGNGGEDNLLNFYNWLDQREGRPFTILIDGANVGYYHQNHEDGRFSYHQLRFMVEFLDQLGENPLVVLPQKYSYNYFNVSVGAPGYNYNKKQIFDREEILIRDTLIRFGKIFFVPGGVLDDFYWIVSSVSSQTVSRKGKDLSVQQGNPRGQWPGTRPVLITNDQMRDHQLDMLDPFHFRRWYSNYIVNYNFAAFVDGVATHPDIGFTPADFFSKEIQSCKDEHGSTIWHFPIANKEDEWFTCRIPGRNDLRIKLKPEE